jgi:predicted DNA-binding transcriptional regulator YafY
VRRADRLFLIVQALRGRRAVPARRLAELLGVSLRTVYRDVIDLQLSGVAIEGAAGLGYTLRRGGDVPPLMFTRDEIEAVVVGVRLTDAFAGERLSRAARQALVKIEAVLPDELRLRTERSRVFAPSIPSRAALRRQLDTLHAAIELHRLTRLAYARADGTESLREVEPLCLAFWGHGWTLGAWCRLRLGFRNFRVDRIRSLEALDEVVPETAERGLAAYLEAVGAPDLEA